MKLVFASLAVAALLATGPALADSHAKGPEKCGSFNQFTKGFYCVACPSQKAAKWMACPGGTSGLFAMRAKHPACTVTDWTKACGKK